MSTKQPAVAVVSHSNRRGPLQLLRLPLVQSVPFCKYLQQCNKHEAFYSKTLLESVFLSGKSNQSFHSNKVNQ